MIFKIFLIPWISFQGNWPSSWKLLNEEDSVWCNFRHNLKARNFCTSKNIQTPQSLTFNNLPSTTGKSHFPHFMAPFYSSVFLDHKSPTQLVVPLLFAYTCKKKYSLSSQDSRQYSYMAGLLWAEFLRPFLKSSKFWTFENFEGTLKLVDIKKYIYIFLIKVHGQKSKISTFVARH